LELVFLLFENYLQLFYTDKSRIFFKKIKEEKLEIVKNIFFGFLPLPKVPKFQKSF